MNDQEAFHYFSTEFSIEGLPSRIEILQALDIQALKDKAAVVRFENPIFRRDGSAGQREFVIVVKGTDTLTDLRGGKEIGVYLFHLDDRVQGSTLDLSGGLKNCQDWGAITVNAKIAADRQALANQAAVNHLGTDYKKL